MQDAHSNACSNARSNAALVLYRFGFANFSAPLAMLTSLISMEICLANFKQMLRGDMASMKAAFFLHHVSITRCALETTSRPAAYNTSSPLLRSLGRSDLCCGSRPVVLAISGQILCAHIYTHCHHPLDPLCPLVQELFISPARLITRKSGEWYKPSGMWSSNPQ
eukprot:1141513-Pelagomonas_calceolata.AAC.1